MHCKIYLKSVIWVTVFWEFLVLQNYCTIVDRYQIMVKASESITIRIGVTEVILLRLNIQVPCAIYISRKPIITFNNVAISSFIECSEPIVRIVLSCSFQCKQCRRTRPTRDCDWNRIEWLLISTRAGTAICKFCFDYDIKLIYIKMCREWIILEKGKYDRSSLCRGCLLGCCKAGNRGKEIHSDWPSNSFWWKANSGKEVPLRFSMVISLWCSINTMAP